MSRLWLDFVFFEKSCDRVFFFKNVIPPLRSGEGEEIEGIWGYTQGVILGKNVSSFPREEDEVQYRASNVQLRIKTLFSLFIVTMD